MLEAPGSTLGSDETGKLGRMKKQEDQVQGHPEL